MTFISADTATRESVEAAIIAAFKKHFQKGQAK